MFIVNLNLMEHNNNNNNNNILIFKFFSLIKKRNEPGARYISLYRCEQVMNAVITADLLIDDL